MENNISIPTVDQISATEGVTTSCGTLTVSSGISLTNTNATTYGYCSQEFASSTIGNNIFSIDDGKDKFTYYVTLYHEGKHQIKNLVFEIIHHGKPYPAITNMLKTGIENYKDNNNLGGWKVVGPIITWTDFLGYIPVIIPEFYETV